ncbi:MAG: hypothetical protein ABEJ77_05285 [Halanaeroarchaeum sp.]
MSEPAAEDADPDRAVPEDVPDWEDEYLDRVSDRLMFNFDLERDVSVGGRRFDMGGTMRIENEKHFLHPKLNYGNHETYEYLYARRQDGVTVADLEALVEDAHDVAEARVERTDDHFSTDVTFVLVVPSISPDVAEFVETYSGRVLLRYGFHGHYEINLVVVAPEERSVAHSENADVWRAFRTWEPIEEDEEPGLLGRIARRIPI